MLLFLQKKKTLPPFAAVQGCITPSHQLPLLLRAFVWFFVIFLAPVMLALLRARFLQNGSRLADRIYKVFKLRPISPIPTGWDWISGRTDPCFVLITLTDGTEIAGYFGLKSMASSAPDRRDIYIEKVYKIPSDDGPWTEVDGPSGGSSASRPAPATPILTAKS